MVDAHAHLDKYGEDLPQALDEIRRSAIQTIGVSMDVDSYRETLRISESEPLVLPSFGIHPWEAPSFAVDPAALDPLLKVAPMLGEVGLDFHFVKDEDQYPAQRTVFEYFLAGAESKGRILNIHTKGAEAAVLLHLQGRVLPGVVIHWYSGPLELVRHFLDQGAYFTVGVQVLRSRHIRSLVDLIPDDRLLTETDNPGGWQWMEGEPGFPDLLHRVEAQLADLKGMDQESVSHLVQENFSRLLAAGGMAG